MLALPSLWWVNRHMPTKAAERSSCETRPFLFLRLVYELFYKPRSYYFFSSSPALGGVLLFPLLAAGLYASSLKARTWWPLWLVAAGSAALYCIAATPTGVRRSIPLAFVASLLLGALFDWALASAPDLEGRRVDPGPRGDPVPGPSDAGHGSGLS